MTSHQALVSLLILLGTAASTFGDESSTTLHQKIDEVVESSHCGSFAKPAAEHEQLRRLYLDLIGRAPTVSETRTFLEQEASGRKQALVEQLLESQEFDEYFATVLDIWFMERRAGSRVPQQEWLAFLHGTLAERWPLDKIVRTVLAADGQPPQRGAAKFLLEREVEPNALTRDTSRIFLGRDLQCAQCHDHPNVGDYLQSEYYGLYAFVNRSYLFEDPKDNKKSYVGERAEGEAEFQSVFFADEPASSTIPKVLYDLALDAEPRADQGNAYLVKPGKSSAAVPRFSRRRQLARLLTHPENRQFARTVANRLWAHMTGQGIVTPVDFDHSENPPSHPELLAVLTDGLIELEFDLRAFLREVALSRAYQRSVDFPSIAEVTLPELTEQIQSTEIAIAKSATARQDAEAERETAGRKLVSARGKLKLVDEQLASAVEKLAQKTQRLTALQQDAQKLQKQLTDKQGQLAALSKAAAASAEALKTLPKDEALTKATTELKSRVNEKQKEIDGIKASIDSNAAEQKTIVSEKTELEHAIARSRSDRIGFADMVAEARGAFQVFQQRLHACETKQVGFEQRLAYLKLYQEWHAQDRQVSELEAKLADAQNNLAQLPDQGAFQKQLKAVEQSEIQAQAGLKKLAQELASEQGQLASKQEALADLDRAAQHLEAASQELGDGDNALPSLVAKLSEQRTLLQEKIDQAQARCTAVNTKIAAACKQQDQIAGQRNQLLQKITSLEKQRDALKDEVSRHSEGLQQGTLTLENAKSDVRQAWQRRYAVRGLKPLTPEQMAGATVSALELRPTFEREAEAEWQKSHQDAKRDASDPKQQAEIDALVEKRLDRVKSTYVTHFAAPAGSPQDVFSSTADQALFISNDGTVQSWLRPSEDTLIHRLQSMDDVSQVIAELYWAVLIRPATESEQQAVSDYLRPRTQDRTKALQEVTWGLLSSAEFRFNH